MWTQTESGRVTHRFEPVMLTLALLIIPVVLIEESHAAHSVKVAAAAANWVIWLGFTVELVGILIVARRKGAALRAHWLEVLIVILTPPFVSGVFAAFRAARLVRLVRLARLGALGGRAIRAEHLFTSRQGFRYVSLLTGLLVAVAGATISVADSKEFPNIGRGMWWAITTVSTVGYGDVVPHTVPGRIIAAALMLVGIGFISMLTATIASSFVAHDTEDTPSATVDEVMDTLRRIEKRLDALERR